MDRDDVRDLTAPIALNSDTDMLFMPFLVLLGMWMIAWTSSYLLKQAEAPGRVAQILLYATVAAFLVGCTLILVNDQTSMNYALQAIFGEQKVMHDGTVRSILLTIVVAGLVITSTGTPAKRTASVAQ